MKPRMMQRSAPHLERGGTIPISRMVRALVASSALLSICGCGGNDGRGGQDGGPPQIGGAPPDGGPRPDGEPPVEPDVTGTVDVTAVDVFGAPLAGAWISLHSNSPYQQAIADTDGRATFRKIRPGVVDASANTFDKAFGIGVGYSGELYLPANGHADLYVIVRPFADAVVGSTVATVAPGGLSADGRSLTFRLNLTYVDGYRRINDKPDPVGLKVSLAECAPDSGNDSPMFTPDCVGGTAGFDAAYGVVEPPAPVVFQRSMPAGLPQPYAAALLLDQSKHIQLNDPADARLFGTKYFLVQNRVTDRVVLAAFGTDDASIGELSPLPQQPVTVFPVQNGTSSFSTIDSLAHLEGGVAPLYAAIDHMLDFIAANETAVGQRRMVVVVTDGRDDTCGTEAQCRDAREGVAEKSLASGIELVTIGLEGGANQDRRALSELTAASRGRSFWVAAPPTQLGVLFGELPDVLSYGGDAVEVSFKIQASTAGAFQSGRVVFATVLLEQCFDWYCTNWSIPIAVRIP